MSWLIWKEYRVNRLILFVGLGMLVAPHAIALICACFHPDDWTDYFSSASMFSMIVTQLILALLGGNAIAGERVDRSAEFLETLPFSRRQNFFSKLSIGPLTALLIWGFNLPIFWLVISSDRIRTGELNDIAFSLAMVAVTGLTFYCAGWLFSSLLNSSVYSTCLGLFTPLVVIMGIQGTIWLLDLNVRVYGRNSDVIIGSWYAGICVALSLVSLVLGSVFYLRRVGP